MELETKIKAAGWYSITDNRLLAPKSELGTERETLLIIELCQQSMNY
jgi:hypothetical protein